MTSPVATSPARPRGWGRTRVAKIIVHPPLIRRTPPDTASFEGVYALFGAPQGVYDYLGDSSRLYRDDKAMGAPVLSPVSQQRGEQVFLVVLDLSHVLHVSLWGGTPFPTARAYVMSVTACFEGTLVSGRVQYGSFWWRLGAHSLHFCAPYRELSGSGNDVHAVRHSNECACILDAP